MSVIDKLQAFVTWADARTDASGLPSGTMLTLADAKEIIAQLAPVPAAPAPEPDEGVLHGRNGGAFVEDHNPGEVGIAMEHGYRVAYFPREALAAFCASAPAPEATREADALCGATTGPLLPGVYDRVHTCTRPSGHFGRHWDGESGWGHVPTREEEQAWCDGMLVQVAAQAREIETLRAQQRGAIRLAGVICDLIDRRALGARSEAGDALIDYASDLYGDERPIECVREAYAALAARAATTEGGANG